MIVKRDEQCPAGAMNSALREKCESIRACLVEGLTRDARARWKAGFEMKAVRDGEARYGSHAIAKLAHALGRDEATLYRHIAVAERWSEGEFTALLGRMTVYGQPLSFSHFIELAAIESDARRATMLERALAESLGVRELARLGREEGNRDPQRGATRGGLRASLSTLAARARQMQKGLLGWTHILQRLEDAEDEAGLDELLEAAIEANRALHAEGALALRRLESVHSKRKARRAGSMTRPAPLRTESRRRDFVSA